MDAGNAPPMYRAAVVYTCSKVEYQYHTTVSKELTADVFLVVAGLRNSCVSYLYNTDYLKLHPRPSSPSFHEDSPGKYHRVNNYNPSKACGLLALHRIVGTKHLESESDEGLRTAQYSRGVCKFRGVIHSKPVQDRTPTVGTEHLEFQSDLGTCTAVQY